MIEARGVTKRLGRRETPFSLENVTFRVNRGSVFGILGGIRSGKTTLIRILATLLAPTSGSVRVDGIDARLDRESVKALLGYQPQAPAVDFNVSLTQYLDFWGGLDGMSAAVRRKRIRESLELLGIAGQGEQRMLDSTTDVQRRAYLALALMHDPPVLLLDEPTAGLTDVERAAFLANLRELSAHGKTIVLTSGKLAFLDTICDRMIVLSDGRASKPLDTSSLLRVVADARHARAFLVTNVPPDQVAPFVREAPGVLDVKVAEPAVIMFVDPQAFRLDEIRRIVLGAGFEIRTLREAEITIGDVYRVLSQKDRR